MHNARTAVIIELFRTGFSQLLVLFKQSIILQGPPQNEKPDLTLTVSDENFAKLVMGKLNPQQVRERELQGPAHVPFNAKLEGT